MQFKINAVSMCIKYYDTFKCYDITIFEAFFVLRWKLTGFNFREHFVVKKLFSWCYKHTFLWGTLSLGKLLEAFSLQAKKEK